MAMEISVTCNWCNKKVIVESMKTPDDWIEHPVHDPVIMGVTTGTFCTSEHKDLHEEASPAAVAAAKKDYTQKYWAEMNEAKKPK